MNDAETETGKGSQESTDVKTALEVKKDEEVAASATSPTMTSSRTAETATEAAKVNDAETETGKGLSQESTDVKTALEVKKDEEVAASATSPTTTSSRTAETATEAVNMKDAEIETGKGSPESAVATLSTAANLTLVQAPGKTLTNAVGSSIQEVCEFRRSCMDGLLALSVDERSKRYGWAECHEQLSAYNEFLKQNGHPEVWFECSDDNAETAEEFTDFKVWLSMSGHKTDDDETSLFGETGSDFEEELMEALSKELDKTRAASGERFLF